MLAEKGIPNTKQNSNNKFYMYFYLNISTQSNHSVWDRDKKKNGTDSSWTWLLFDRGVKLSISKYLLNSILALPIPDPFTLELIFLIFFCQYLKCSLQSLLVWSSSSYSIHNSSFYTLNIFDITSLCIL
jgi:hypothetical protein